MVVEPVAIPVTTPVDKPTVAIVDTVLLQLPPPVASVITTELPTHTEEGPDIAAGIGLTVTIAVA